MKFRSLLLAVALVAATLVVTWQHAPRAAACSCMALTATEHADMAALVARGTVVSVERPARPTSSNDDATYTVALAQVWKGDPAGAVQVLTAVEGASCGWEGITEGMDIILFAQAEGTFWRSNLCDGSGPADDAVAAELTAYLGAPRVVEPMEATHSAGPLADPAVAGVIVLALVMAGVGVWFVRRR